jgi:NAD+ kinase
MTLPIDLVLVRHGESEGNVANKRSRAGDHSVFTPEFQNRHSSGYRLSNRGQQQAKRAGAFLREKFLKNGIVFDYYFTSAYVRAMETAGLLGIPEAQWNCDVYLTERDWGNLDRYPDNERYELFGEALARHDDEPFFWRPPGGESFLELCMRVDRVLDTLHRECADKRVLIVCHGEVMRAFQMRIERMSQERFRELVLSKESRDVIYNCQIVQYTRASPFTGGHQAPFANWVRWFRPTDTPVSYSDWMDITRQRYSNEDLLAVAERVPRLVKE